MSAIDDVLAPYQKRFDETLKWAKTLFGEDVHVHGGGVLPGERRSHGPQLKGEAHSKSYGRRLQAEGCGASSARKGVIPREYVRKASHLREACFYALETGGKRIRPALVYMIAEKLGGDRYVNPAALCIEFLHTSSLIADDLPCMDNDTLRRGRPTLHCAYDETTALLASYALIGAAYEILGKGFERHMSIAPFALQQVGASTGIRGISGGQYLDIFHSKEKGFEAVEKKTAALFETALVLGWLFGGGPIFELPRVKRAGRKLGVAFQILDDLLDLEQDREKGSLNLALEWGVEEAVARYFAEEKSLLADLKALRIDSEPLKALLEALHQEVLVCENAV